jgi:hypothetical protein
MNWRDFKTRSQEIKGAKVAKPCASTPFATFTTFAPGKQSFKSNVSQVDVKRLLDDAVDEIDSLGSPWPARFLLDMPAEDRSRLREIEAAIDTSVLGGDGETLDELLTAWRDLVLSHLN